MTAPSLTAFIQGQGACSADNLNTFEQTCDVVAQIREFIGLPGIQVYVRGISAPDDGGQGFFYWQATVTETDDGKNYIIPPGAGGGGWVRIGPELVLPIPTIVGSLSLVTDANAKVVLTSIVSALTGLGLVTNGTT